MHPTGTKRWRKRIAGRRGHRRRGRRIARNADARLGARIGPGRLRPQLRRHRRRQLALRQLRTSAAKRIDRQRFPRPAEVAVEPEPGDRQRAARNPLRSSASSARAASARTLFWIVTCGRQPPRPARVNEPRKASARSARMPVEIVRDDRGMRLRRRGPSGRRSCARRRCAAQPRQGAAELRLRPTAEAHGTWSDARAGRLRSGGKCARRKRSSQAWSSPPSSAVTISAPAIGPARPSASALDGSQSMSAEPVAVDSTTSVQSTRRRVSPTPGDAAVGEHEIGEPPAATRRPWRRRSLPTLSPRPRRTSPLVSSETGNRSSPGVSWLASAAVPAPSSTFACRPSQRQMPKMLRSVRTALVHSSAGWPVSIPVANQASDPTRKTHEAVAGDPRAEVGGGDRAPRGWSRAVATHWMMSAMSAPMRQAAEGSDFDLAAKLDDAVGRELEELHRAFGVAQHPRRTVARARSPCPGGAEGSRVWRARK